jgi:hypothetical protein
VEILKYQIEEVILDQKGVLSTLTWEEWHSRKEEELSIGGRIGFSFLHG